MKARESDVIEPAAKTRVVDEKREAEKREAEETERNAQNKSQPSTNDPNNKKAEKKKEGTGQSLTTASSLPYPNVSSRAISVSDGASYFTAFANTNAPEWKKKLKKKKRK